jgi:hypothetical protein
MRDEHFEPTATPPWGLRRIFEMAYSQFLSINRHLPLIFPNSQAELFYSAGMMKYEV